MEQSCVFNVLFDQDLIRDLIVVVVVLALSIHSSRANVDSTEVKNNENTIGILKNSF